VSFVPCCNCGQRVKGKLATSYNAWFNELGERECWIQKYCAACLTEQMGSLLATMALPSSDLAACPGCGKDSSVDQSPIYLTVFVPKREPLELALPMCRSCATEWHALLRVNSTKAADRQGLGPQAPDPWSDWAPVPPRPSSDGDGPNEEVPRKPSKGPPAA
jgi:hypothetical protein